MTNEIMTNEEAINTLKSLKQYYNDKNEDSYVGFDTDDNESIDMAIKALNQESVLDKIRAEISDFEEEVFNKPNTDYSDYAAVRHCLEIIDKYKAESEE